LYWKRKKAKEAPTKLLGRKYFRKSIAMELLDLAQHENDTLGIRETKSKTDSGKGGNGIPFGWSKFSNLTAF
jgi:hypothetical protein